MTLKTKNTRELCFSWENLVVLDFSYVVDHRRKIPTFHWTAKFIYTPTLKKENSSPFCNGYIGESELDFRVTRSADRFPIQINLMKVKSENHVFL